MLDILLNLMAEGKVAFEPKRFGLPGGPIGTYGWQSLAVALLQGRVGDPGDLGFEAGLHAGFTLGGPGVETISRRQSASKAPAELWIKFLMADRPFLRISESGSSPLGHENEADALLGGQMGQDALEGAVGGFLPGGGVSVKRQDGRCLGRRYFPCQLHVPSVSAVPRGYGGGHSGLHQCNDVHLTFDQHQRLCSADECARTRQAVQHAAFVEQRMLARVDIFRRFVREILSGERGIQMTTRKMRLRGLWYR